jgi:photosystem II stability/assembly factor-like uncharacterized protein
MKGLRVLALAGVVCAAAAMPLAQARTDATNTVHSVLSQLYYRPLTIFSRGGRVTAVTGVPSKPGVFYMGAAGGGVWRTTNSGERWEPITDGQIGVGTIGAVDVSLSNPDIIYIGTGSADPRGNVTNGDGVYKSTDGGKTWMHIGLEKAGLIGRVRIHPTNPDIAYVAVLGNIFGPNPERGVYMTKDGGKTWTQSLKVSENTGAEDLSMDPKNPEVLFASMWTARRTPWTIDSGSMEGGIFRSKDGGATWQKLTTGLPQGEGVLFGKSSVSVSGADSKRVYALIEAGTVEGSGEQGGVFVSNDGGDTWTKVTGNRNLLQRAFYYLHIYADPQQVDTAYAVNTGAYRSTDGGKTWTGLGVPHSDNHDFWINPTNNKILINGNDGGANVSTDGGQTWSTQNNQMTAELYRIETDTRWPYWIYASQQDNSNIAVPSNNVGETFSVAGGESGYMAVDPRNADIIYAGNYGGTLERTDRYSGISESVRVYADEETGQRAADMKYRFQWDAPIRMSPHNPDILYTTSQYVHKSTDAGQTWNVISPDLTRNDKSKQDFAGAKGITRDDTGVEVYDTIFAFEESPVTAGLLWAGSDDGLLWLSRDTGKNWSKITPPDLPEWSTVNVIDLSGKNAGRAIVTAYRYMLNDFNSYVYLTNDYGKTWKKISDGIPAGDYTRVVREDPDRPGLLYAGTEHGMYISFDEGAHWQPFQQNLPRTPIMDLKIYRKNLIVATEGRGFWILDALPVVEQFKADMDGSAATLFKPADAYRQGGALPTFYYWLKDKPAQAVTLEVKDSGGKVVYTATAQPTDEQTQPPSAVPPDVNAGGRGRGGRGGGGGGRGGRGFGGGGAALSARPGLNEATWNARLEAPFTVPPRIVMWGGGGGRGGGPKAAPGTYTVKVSSGSWSQEQTFRLSSDPRLPAVTDAEGLEQQKMAMDVGAQIKTLYDTLAKLRDVKQQTAKIAEKGGAVAAPAKTFTDQITAVEGDMTQLQGEAGQDALNFPGRLDNQLVALYSNIAQEERKLNKSVKERYEDLRKPTDDVMKRAQTVLTTDLAAFNEASTKAGAGSVIVK